MAEDTTRPRLNIEKPKYDQSTFSGRAMHFFITTNPLNILATPKQLADAKDLVDKYRAGTEPKGTTDEQVWKAKQLYDSAFHPDTGQKMNLIGRMSAQVPMNMTITGCMLTFYKTSGQTIFWQWINQTFNAIVNYTNRSGDSPIPLSKLGLSYALATGGAVTTALGMNKLVNKFPPIVARFVPFTAVAAANCINIPFMRSSELSGGIPVFDSNGNRVGDSKAAAKKAISLVVFSRIAMASPGMLLTPIIMSRLERGRFLTKYPAMNAPCQIAVIGLVLVFATPLCCALFPQQSSIHKSHLEPDLQDKLNGLENEYVTFNKGL